MGASRVEVFRDEQPGQPTVSGFIHYSAMPTGDAIVLTHSAGSNCESPLLVALASAFSFRGSTVLRCDLPFRLLRPKGRPLGQSATRDQAGLKRAVELMKAKISKRVYLGGHAYGGHQASLLAASESSLVNGLLLLSYPLHPPQQPTQLRNFHFPSLRTPALFIQASRDPFGTPQEVREALAKLPRQAKLVVVKNARQDLLTESNRNSLPMMVVREFREFFGEVQSTK
jgi:uncharacterized protein